MDKWKLIINDLQIHQMWVELSPTRDVTTFYIIKTPNTLDKIAFDFKTD